MTKSPSEGRDPTPRGTPLVATMNAMASRPPAVMGTPVPQTIRQQQPFVAANNSPLRSPCFVHSQLDKGASFTDWLKSSPENIGGQTQPQPSMNGRSIANGASSSEYSSSPDEEVFERDEDEQEAYGHASLTKQLAETAVGVREMSKQLGEHTASCLKYLRY
jgi:hypothetical protein